MHKYNNYKIKYVTYLKHKSRNKQTARAPMTRTAPLAARAQLIDCSTFLSPPLAPFLVLLS